MCASVSWVNVQKTYIYRIIHLLMDKCVCVCVCMCVYYVRQTYEF